MLKVFRFLAISIVSFPFTLSSAWAHEFETIQFPGAVFTQLTGGPNLEGTSVGDYTDAAGLTHGFKLTIDGKMTSFDPPGSQFTTPNYINLEGVIVGGYLDAGGVARGFVLRGGQFTTLDFPGAAGTILTGISSLGEISGESCESILCDTITHSFIRSVKGVFTSFDPPGAVSSGAATVSIFGEVVGSYTDSAGNTHGYALNHGTYTTIDVPGAVFTFAGGGNDQGDVVGTSANANGVTSAFLLSKGTFTTFEAPGAGTSSGQGSGASGINVEGTIVGIYVNSANTTFGFIRYK
jgi:probable HAF family extracellular repeat protein